MEKETGKKIRGLPGVTTIEMAYLIPIILFLCMMLIFTTFYFHDKMILIGAASETAVTQCELERMHDTSEDMNAFFQERIAGKLIFFSGANAAVSDNGEWIEVQAAASKGRFSVNCVLREYLMQPEKKIRTYRRLKELVNQEGK